MNGPDNKPFKTRTGGVMKLQELIQTLQTAAFDKIQEEGLLEGVDMAEKQETALKIGIAALKFADLQHDPSQNYQFSLEKFMRFEGKTGPYVQYAAVRIKSLLKRAEDLNIFPGKTLIRTTPYQAEERALLLALLRFPEYIHRAAQQRGPNVLCEGVFELAQVFSRFYQACPILMQEDKDTQKDWLLLCKKTHDQLETYLGLLGIDIPPRM
jgi:arginyl-tRNA synthetase